MTTESSPVAISGDLSESFLRERRAVTHPSGTTVAEFIRGLEPRYSMVWMSLFGGVAGLVVIAVVLTLIELSLIATVVVVPVAAAAIGLLLHFIALYLHEAAHFNLASQKATSDRIANVIVGPLSLIDVRDYRAVHLDHHKHLATDLDPERSYEHPLTARFVVRGLTGLLALEVTKRRSALRAAAGQSTNPRLVVPLVGLLIHATPVVWGLATRSWALALGWGFGVFSVFPFLGALRPVLEHRDPVLGSEFAVRAYTRNFTPKVWNRLFGGAGFHHHLIHHWEPSVSCTRLAELHTFFAQSSVGDIVADRTTTYTQALREVHAASRR